MKLFESPHIKLRYLFVLMLAFFSILLRDNFSASWGMVDDHEIVEFLGGNSHLPPSEFLPSLMRTEANLSHDLARYRPSYYTIRLCECMLFGEVPVLWYTGRILVFSLGFAMSVKVLAVWLGRGFSLLCIFFILTFDLWSDIFCRLGPSEIYCFIGSVIVLYGCYLCFGCLELLERRSSSSFSSGLNLMILGVLIAAGSKENFVFLNIFPFVCLAAAIKKRRHVISSFFVFLLSSSYCLWIGLVVFSRISVANADIYANSIDASSRLASLGLGKGLIGNLLWSIHAGHLLLIGIPVALILASCYISRKVPVVIAYYGLTGIFISSLYIFQHLFYNGAIPLGNRYDFPAMILVVLLWTCLFGLADRVLGRLSLWRAQTCWRFFVFCLVCALIVCNGYRNTRSASIANCERTRQFQSVLNRAVQQLSEFPDAPLIVYASASEDCEPIMALPRFLRHYGVSNDVQLVYRPLKQEDRLLWLELILQVEDLEKNGGKGYTPQSLSEESHYYTVGISEVPSVPYMNFIGVLWPDVEDTNE